MNAKNITLLITNIRRILYVPETKEAKPRSAFRSVVQNFYVFKSNRTV